MSYETTQHQSAEQCRSNADARSVPITDVQALCNCPKCQQPLSPTMQGWVCGCKSKA